MMWKKMSDWLDVRTENQTVNIILGGIISFVIASSLTRLLTEGYSWRLMIFCTVVLWMPIILGEVKGTKEDRQ